MEWAQVIEELERQAAFAEHMSAKNTIDQEIAKAFGVRADMLLAIAVRLRFILEQEDFNAIWSQAGERPQATSPTSSATFGLCSAPKANE